MYYSGNLIVKNNEGVRENHNWGVLNKLLCRETTKDEEFTFGEMTCRPGGVRGPATGDEAFHCLRGEGLFRAWPKNVPDKEPIEVRIRPGSEYYVRHDIPRTIENTGSEPLFGIFMFCHVERPCHAHPLYIAPGKGNEIHQHGPEKLPELLKQDFVEAMYLVDGPGWVSLADPSNMVITDHAIERGSAVYHPLNSLHRQFTPSDSKDTVFWIHAGYYHGRGRIFAGVFDDPEFTFWHKDR
ncbi:MAG: hypothetical protein CMN58_06145 [Solibacterales bacterium]|uniref:Uncharacterized protein n=1 Tax=Candidatus Moanibacter tarae TaxID=2200854 RepID=A0A2Z4ADJ9_9BACT|nr:MAG: hypothetical protein DF168_01539 [Candidatus Moanabacter tarae]MBG99908.1 hypothetical protein [Bryobacterales bacterium]|tara:strand:+ start:2541 stop:3260 length:720 start_codon:yes stop_codon:yes gene_type:complete